MKLKTSFFNTSLLRKDIRRFAPTWALFLIFLLMRSIPMSDYDWAWELADSIGGFAVVNLAYAMICAQLLFGDLFSSRMCYALHALPVRRESWFATHVLAGLCFCAGPVTVSAVVWTIALGKYWLVSLLWAAALLLQFLFFFSVAVLSMLLTGNRIGALAIYSILNFLAGIVLWLVYALYVPHLYGVELNYEPWLRLCPVVGMVMSDWVQLSMTDPSLTALLEGWGYLLWCVLAALPCYGLALWLYRKRKLESTGDIMAFRPLAPVFLVVFTLSAGAAFHLFSELFVGEESLVFLVVGLCVGFYACLMLLRRSVRVFRLRTLAQLGVILGVFGLTLLVTALDPMGITKWVPMAENVKAVSVSPYYMEMNGVDTYQAVEDPEIIEQVIALHEYAIAHPEEAENGKADISINLSYWLKDGRKVYRAYLLDVDTPMGKKLETLLSQPEFVFGKKYSSVDKLLSDVYKARYHDGEKDIEITDAQQLQELVEAVYADCLEGNFCQNWNLIRDNGQEEALVLIGSTDWYLTYTEKSIHVQAWFQKYMP